MQRICRVRGGVNAYLLNPGALVTEQTRRCPFCADAHLLWLVGWYWRWVVLPTPEEPRKIPIRRLYCRHARRTVSLLPDFCIPRRQCGPGVLEFFLRAYVMGASLVRALRMARGEANWHSAAQSLLQGFPGAGPFHPHLSVPTPAPLGATTTGHSCQSGWRYCQFLWISS